MEVRPLISCVLPTYNRRRFIPLAPQCFLSQDYPDKELLLLDDGTDPVGEPATAALQGVP